MTEELKDGTDSGAVPDKVKLQVFVNGLGICAAPDCSDRLMQNRTRLGECAHIIPRRVGSHPREDGTPLDDRKKEENLLYLCERHHKIVDNIEHAAIYTADLLRKWKRDHETWGAGITKDSPYLPQDIKAMLASVGTQIAEQANVSETIVRKLLDTCHELLHRQLINEARAFLSQIDILLIDANNLTLSARADLLNAILAIRSEKIPEAKKQLLQIIQAHPQDVEAMLEYVELCDTAPEADDEGARIEKLARDLANDHPRLLLIDLARKYQNQELVEEQNIFNKQMNDVRLNARLICQHALFCDLSQKTDQRDNLINKWEKVLPNSPRPHLFKVLYRTSDIFRSPIQQAAQPLQEALEFSREEREGANTKDPLTLRDQILWLIQEMRLELIYAHISGAEKDASEIRNGLISLIEQCYFDSLIDANLPAVLSQLRVEQNQWRVLTRKIQESKMLPSRQVVELLFLQALRYDELHADLEEFVTTYGHDDLLQILRAIKDGNTQKAAESINAKKDSVFSFILLQSISEREIAVSLAELLEVCGDHQADLLFARLDILDLHQRDEEALGLIARLSIDEAAPFALHTVERITYRNKQWHLFIPSALRLLNFDIPQPYRIQLHGTLAIAYFHQGDDTNAITHAEHALSHPEELGEENAHNILRVLGQSLVMKGLPDEACRKFQQYGQIKRSFSLLLEEADIYLNSGFADKHEKALSLIMRAFEEADVYEDRLYLSAFMLLVELGNTGKIPSQNEPSIEDGLFVKLDGFPNGWFYIGEEESLGAECIKPGTANYTAVIHKSISEEIEWPADKFAKPNVKHKILHIVTAPEFLSWRAHEAMENVARLGNAPIWSIRVVNEEGSIDKENLRRFYQEQFYPNHEFFETYTNSPLPFSFLCKMQGSLTQAIGRLSSERKGFIRCNNGTQADLEAQKATANDALNGTTCFIEGLAALVLAEARLLEIVINALPNLSVSTSVIRLLRETAGEFQTTSSSMGRGTFVEGNFEFRPRDKEMEETLRNQLLWAADMLLTFPLDAVS